MLFGLGKKKLLGLDIGSSTIKIAEVTQNKKGVVLESFGMIPTPPQATSGGEIVDPVLISESVRRLLDDLKSKRKHIAAGLWGSSVIVKRISIPRMDEALISEQIRWEAEQYIPYDINEVNLDYKILSFDSPGDTMDILLIAAIQEMIFNIAELVTGAGMNCAVLDVESFALANCFEANYGIQSGETIGLLNVGASVTNFAVVESGEVIFCRDMPLGGLLYTNEISKSMGISMTEAEGLKISMGVDQATPEEVSAIISATHDMMAEELGSSIEFFQNTTAESELSKVYVTGGGSKVYGFLESMANVVSCEKMDPFLLIGTNSKFFTPDYIEQIQDFCSISLGLGMREVGDT